MDLLQVKCEDETLINSKP